MIHFEYICSNLTNDEKGVRNLKRCLEIIHTKLNLYARLMKKGSTLFDKNEVIEVTFSIYCYKKYCR